MSEPKAQPVPGLRRLSVRHETRYEYDAPVEVAHHSAWLRPRETPWQVVRQWQLEIEPAPDAPVQESRDAFGNWRHGFGHDQVHDHLTVCSSFQVELTTQAPMAPDSDAPSPEWESVVKSLSYRAGQQQPEAAAFVPGTEFAPRHAGLAAFGRDLFVHGRGLAELAWELMLRVHGHMRYQPHSTDVATSAVQALRQRSGVCQDFAHLMIGVLRSHGLAARYVSGYLLTQPPPGQPRLVGADASHAWVAVWCPVQGWLALDPTNAMRAGHDHVTLAWGRDYADVAPLRGVIRGGGQAVPQVAVTVAPLDDDSATTGPAQP